MNPAIKKVKKLIDKQLTIRIAELDGWQRGSEPGWHKASWVVLNPEKFPDYVGSMDEIEKLKSALTGSRAVPPTGEVALYFDALLAVTRGEVLAIFATPRQCAEAWYLAKTYKPE